MADKIEDNKINLLEQKHRKEKKELQAQIQAFKKAAKNDKTKKKELSAEIARLEAELEERHKKEYEDSQNDSVIVTELEHNEVAVSDTNKQKISKAQKRREKKLQQEKDREKEIKLQEQENLHGPRNIEHQAMSARLQERKLKVYAIRSDGDCLYRAVAHQLNTKYNRKISVNSLRQDVATYILENKDEFMPFMCNPDTGLNLTDVEFEEYCDKIRNTKVWGGHIEIQALSNCLKCPITVIQATGPVTDQGTEFSGSPLIITYHRHMYSLGEHYNSTEVLNGADT